MKSIYPSPCMYDVEHIHAQPVRELWHPDYVDVMMSYIHNLETERNQLKGWLHRGMEAIRGQANLKQSKQGPFQKSMRVLLDEIEGASAPRAEGGE